MEKDSAKSLMSLEMKIFYYKSVVKNWQVGDERWNNVNKYSQAPEVDLELTYVMGFNP